MINLQVQELQCIHQWIKMCHLPNAKISMLPKGPFVSNFMRSIIQLCSIHENICLQQQNKKNHVANEVAKCQKQKENALLAGQKQVGRMKNKILLCCQNLLLMISTRRRRRKEDEAFPQSSSRLDLLLFLFLLLFCCCFCCC